MEQQLWSQISKLRWESRQLNKDKCKSRDAVVKRRRPTSKWYNTTSSNGPKAHQCYTVNLGLVPRSFDFTISGLSILFTGSTVLLLATWIYVFGISLKKKLIGLQHRRQIDCEGTFEKTSRKGRAVVRSTAGCCSRYCLCFSLDGDQSDLEDSRKERKTWEYMFP